MRRIQEEWNHEYNLTQLEYPISDNVRPATYDQFITQRDTLVTSNKYYADKAGRSLIIWTKLDWTPTDTIEIREPNIFSQNFQPWGWVDDADSTWTYTKAHTWWTNNKSCDILKTGRYRVQHKEQFASIPSTITRIHSFVTLHKASGWTENIAAFDWEWDTPWEIKRLTSFGYREIDLHKWDWLELKIEDQWWNDILSQVAYDSNWWMVEYIDLAYK